MNRAETFESLHRENADPWDARSWYERRKRDISMSSLPRERYERAFEPGCSNGALTDLLRTRCDELVAADISETALTIARNRIAGHANIDFRHLDVPDDWPDGSFDLVIVSELAYFLHPDELELLVARACDSLRAGGDLVVVDWRGPIERFHGLDAHAVHDRLRAQPDLTTVVLHEEPEFVLEVFRR